MAVKSVLGRLLIFMCLLPCNKCENEIDLFKALVEKMKLRCFSNPSHYLSNSSIPKCNITFHRAVCWPETPTGTNVHLVCPRLFFYQTDNITRRCNENGVWGLMDHSKCKRLSDKDAVEVIKESYRNLTNSTYEAEDYYHFHMQKKIYMIFSWISCGFMIPSLIMIFVFIKQKNERFILHKNLILAFLLRTLTFFVHYHGNLGLDPEKAEICTVFWVINRYFAVAEIAWLLNEAVFLLKKVIWVFDERSYFYHFLFIGWGFPALLTFCVYIPIMRHVIAAGDPRCWTHYNQSSILLVLYIPMTIMLVVNLFVLLYLIHVILTKLKASNAPETVRAWKAVKGALILVPALGVIYLMIMYVPKGHLVYDYIIRVLYPLQAALVCLVYVLFSGEMHEAIRRSWRKYRQEKSIAETIMTGMPLTRYEPTS